MEPNALWVLLCCAALELIDGALLLEGALLVGVSDTALDDVEMIPVELVEWALEPRLECEDAGL